MRVCKELAKALGILRYNTELPSEKFVQRGGNDQILRGEKKLMSSVF